MKQEFVGVGVADEVELELGRRDGDFETLEVAGSERLTGIDVERLGVSDVGTMTTTDVERLIATDVGLLGTVDIERLVGADVEVETLGMTDLETVGKIGVVVILGRSDVEAVDTIDTIGIEKLGISDVDTEAKEVLDAGKDAEVEVEDEVICEDETKVLVELKIDVE